MQEKKEKLFFNTEIRSEYIYPILYILEIFLIFFPSTFLPLGKGRNTAISRPTVFFQPSGRMVQQRSAQKISMVLAKQTAKRTKKTSKTRSDTGKGSYKHNRPDLWDRGSIILVCNHNSKGCVFETGVQSYRGVKLAHNIWYY